MQIPNGITFGSKVAVVPGYASGITHSGNVVSLMARQSYRWVARGEAIGEFRIEGSFGDSFLSRLISSKTHSAPIKCPVSGLLLYSELKDELSGYLKDWNSMKQPPIADFALLLPDDEPKPESGKYIYSEMCQLIRDMKHYYFKDSRYWTLPAFSPDNLEKLIEYQIAAQSKIFDALPRWSDYLDEARTKKPELRPFLKHLAKR